MVSSQIKGKFGRDRWTRGYQWAVGWKGSEDRLHENSKELVGILKDNEVITDGMKVFEIGAGPCRNLKYIWDVQKNINMHINDLYERSLHYSHEDIKNKVKLHLVDTLSLVEGIVKYPLLRALKQTSPDIDDYYRDGTAQEVQSVPHTDVDLLISSDHLMHVDYKSADIILKKIRDEWKPKYILLREIKKEYENPSHPRLYHNYDIFDKNYDIIFEKTSDNASEYFIKLYRRKND